MFSKSLKILISTLSLASLVSCVDISSPVTPYQVNWPTEGLRVVDADISNSSSTVQISLAGTERVPIYFNGQNHDGCFAFSGSQATAPLSCFAPFIRQGENIITINPSSLLNSYQRSFIIDSTGPKINVADVCYISGNNCALSDTGEVSFDVNYIDPSNIASASLLADGISYLPNQFENKIASFQVPVSNQYIFSSTDSNGFTSQHTIKRDGDRLEQIVNVRIDEEMLDALLPLINKGVSGMESGAADGSDLLLENIEIQALGIVNLLADVKYLKINNFELQNLSINDSSADLEANLTMEPFAERDVDWFNSNGTVENADDVGIEVMMSVQDVLWCFDPFGWIDACQPCEHSAFDECQTGLIKMDMHMYIEKMNVNAKVNNDIVENGNFHVKLEKLATGQDVLVMKDTYAAMSGDGVSGSQANGILGELISGSLLRGLILDIVEDTINRNLNELVIGATFLTDENTDTEMAISAQVENLTTDLGLGGDNIGNLNVDLSGVFDTVKSDSSIQPALGSYHVNDDVLPIPIDDGSSLSVVVNSNMINQALLAAYNTGITHLTVAGSEMLTGINTADDSADNGSFRVELHPSSPGQFHVNGELSNKANAFLEFHGAEAFVSYKSQDQWKPVTELNVDIRAGVYLTVVDGFLGMSIASSPELIINNMSDISFENSFQSGAINISSATKVNKDFVVNLVQTAIERYTPAIADSVLKIDVSKLGISENLFTDGVSTESGHLEFKQGLSQ